LATAAQQLAGHRKEPMANFVLRPPATLRLDLPAIIWDGEEGLHDIHICLAGLCPKKVNVTKA
jgi:hypothetical protein